MKGWAEASTMHGRPQKFSGGGGGVFIKSVQLSFFATTFGAFWIPKTLRIGFLKFRVVNQPLVAPGMTKAWLYKGHFWLIDEGEVSNLNDVISEWPFHSELRQDGVKFQVQWLVDMMCRTVVTQDLSDAKNLATAWRTLQLCDVANKQKKRTLQLRDVTNQQKKRKTLKFLNES